MSTFKVQPALDSSHETQSTQRRAFWLKCGLLAGGVLMLIVSSVVVAVVATRDQSPPLVGGSHADSTIEGLNADPSAALGTTTPEATGQGPAFLQEPAPPSLQDTTPEPMWARTKAFVTVHWRVIVPAVVVLCALVAVSIFLAVYFEQQRLAELAAEEERQVRELQELEERRRLEEEEKKQTLPPQEVVSEGLSWFAYLGIGLGVNLVLTIPAIVYSIVVSDEPPAPLKLVLAALFTFILCHGWVILLVFIYLVGRFFTYLAKWVPGPVIQLISIPLLLLHTVMLVAATPYLTLIRIFFQGTFLSEFWNHWLRCWSELRVLPPSDSD